ncbi:MAG: dihydroneopterin aldolase [Epsilonproteobacteria bacterium (ex Lamellibrachia satsuma)]|nr:MAG: dihydroneopterin aldolase [Epsilonproteobacteria bacterium (ex Lamellibrachia satsuma)]
MNIHIEHLELDIIIGILDFERERAQRIIIDMEASYDYTDENFIDYADMVFLIQQELKEKRYTLLEEALLGLKALLYTAYPHIQTLTLKISKPDILPQCSVALSHSWEF